MPSYIWNLDAFVPEHREALRFLLDFVDPEKSARAPRPTNLIIASLVNDEPTITVDGTEVYPIKGVGDIPNATLTPPVKIKTAGFASFEGRDVT